MVGKPSFYQLFRRSRYASVQPDMQAPGRLSHNQQEVFAVAALGFALRHQPAFMDHFVRTIFRFAIPTTKRFDIRCQDGHKADLAIVWPGKRVLVVEAKIHAELDPKQNPTYKEFHTQPKGYGFQINRDYPNERERYYVVLAKTVSAFSQRNLPGQHPEFLGFRRWGELGGMADEPSLVSDLFDTLGQLGISELQLRSFRNMKLEKTATSAARMFKLLDALADELEIDRRKDLWDIADSTEGAHFGVNIGSGRRFAKLSRHVGSSSEPIGWFGYESPKNGKPRRSFWIYPKDKRGRERAEKYAKEVHNLSVNDSGSEDLAFCVAPKDCMNGDDITWFRTVLLKLAD